MSVKGKNKFKLERRQCEKYLSSFDKRESDDSSLKLFQGYFQKGKKINITQGADGKGY